MRSAEKESIMVSRTSLAVLIAIAAVLAGVPALVGPASNVDFGNAHANARDSSSKATVLMQQPLADYPGKASVIALVEFAPGHVDPAHRHPGHAFVYVLEGSIEMQMEGGELRTLNPGDTYYENPRSTHLVGRNVSKTKPAKLLVFFVSDRDAPLVLAPGHS
jgi:quercetin dioxygenase-like cupin family protein